MKILCICKQGIVRSGALSWILKLEYHHDAIAAGCDTNGPEVIAALAKWANKIICFDNRAYHLLPFEEADKAVMLDIGEDQWHDPAHPELHRLLRQKIKDMVLL